MKLLTVAVPCFNSESYMERCIDSLLPGGAAIDILIVDDGSNDRTAEIADRYVRQFPGMVRVIHQENKGHGGAVNTAVANALGKFFKVVDSDDWLEEHALLNVMKVLRSLAVLEKRPDMVITNYVYNNQTEEIQKVMRYRKMESGAMISWEKGFHVSMFEFILMHSIIYRTELLREIHMKLPENTWYEDDLYAFYPLIYVKDMFYIDVDLYQYSIGRPDQSVNEKVLITRIDDHLKVVKQMIDIYTAADLSSSIQKRYMEHFLDMMMCIGSCILDLSDTKENRKKKEEFWKYVKEADEGLYRTLRHSPYGIAVNIPGRSGRMISRLGYRAAHWLYGFN